MDSVFFARLTDIPVCSDTMALMPFIVISVSGSTEGKNKPNIFTPDIYILSCDDLIKKSTYYILVNIT